MRVCVQEQHLPGSSMEEKWESATTWGFDGIELRGQGGLALEQRLPELKRAQKAGVAMPTVCVEMPHFIGAFDAELRADAIRQMRSQLTVMSELEGRGAMTPASYGMFSRRLPPFEPPRSPAEDTAILVDAFGELADHARPLGVAIFLEPLNRYEDHMVNRLADAVELIEQVGNPAFQVAADTYHMNIEEADLAQALRHAAPHLGHFQASDSNRLEPGAGHLDWASLRSVLDEIGYRGDIAIESRLSGPAGDVLPTVLPLLRGNL